MKPRIVERVWQTRIPEHAVQFRMPADVEMLGSATPELDQTAIGSSRRGQTMHGWRFGRGEIPVSIVAGCHADEPVGPMTAQLLPQLLTEAMPDILERFRFCVVPQMNPDGADDNRPWFANPPSLKSYVAHAVREQPGDDIEFGFGGDAPRPEAAAAMTFLGNNGPFAAHISLHGMGFGEGAWFLICREWVERSPELIAGLRALASRLELGLHDVDREGEKGFARIGEGFCTTPLSTAMRHHFTQREESEIAQRFRPTSMEFVQALGGDPFCGVTEMPLFLIDVPREDLVNTPTQRLRRELGAIESYGEPLEDIAARYRIRPLALETQIRMQLAFIVMALHTVQPD